MIERIDVEGWPPPQGYVNALAATGGRTIYVAGQIGWTKEHVFHAKTFVEQFAQALDNVLAVVHAAGGRPKNIVRMTVYVTDLAVYRATRKELGHAWKQRMEKHFPAMALVGVSGLVEEQAMVEIEATAVVP